MQRPVVPVSQGCSAARLCAVTSLSVATHSVGDIEQPSVVHDATDFLVELFAAARSHVRSAQETSVLPIDVSAKIEAAFEVLEGADDASS